MRRLICLCLLAVSSVSAYAQDWKHKPVLDTSRSPKAVLRGVPVSAVKFGEGFWTPRRQVNVDASLPSLLELFEQKGILDNFRRVGGGKDVARRGPLYTDSDVYKWVEAVGFVLQERNHPTLRQAAAKVINDIAAAQEASGYINTFYSKENLSQRHQNMRHGHELYCLGHLIQAGIAWQRATGETKLLDVGKKMADYVYREFGATKQPIFEGHPEIELALAELYRTTGDKKYLELAGYMLAGDKRNEPNVPPREFVYLFTAKPFTSRQIMEGHAVRAGYACAGAADYYLETGDEAYATTLKLLWEDMTTRKPGYVYSTSNDGLWVHLYHASTLNWKLEDGTPIQLEQKTEYPWKGAVEMIVKPGATKEFSLHLRVPEWSSKTTLLVNGKAWSQSVKTGSYVDLKRTWKAGDTVRLALDVMPRLTQSNLRIRENIGKVAVERGPLLYCMEGHDQPLGTTVFDWYLNAAQPQWEEEWKPNLLGGVLTLTAKGSRPAETAAERPIYERFPAWPPAQRKSGELTFIPYYTFTNRGTTTMQVWVPVE